MKVLINKYRILLNLWALRNEIRTHEALIDQFERDLNILSEKVEMLSDFLPQKTPIRDRLAEIRRELSTHSETANVLKRAFQRLQKELLVV